jgi:hypothetical protein
MIPIEPFALDSDARGICQHRTVKVVKMESGLHDSKEVCASCGTFIKWLPKPETVERQKRNAAELSRLSQRQDLPKWEKEFVASLITQGPKLSPRQQKMLDEVSQRFP